MDNSASLQGIVDARIERLNNYRRSMADVQLTLNPLAVDGEIIFNSRALDTYNEGILTEESRLTKRMVLSKTPDMHYVQDRALADLLVEHETGGYVLRLTTTTLPRIISIDDQVVIGGITYTISKVSPYNRFNDSILVALVYPVDDQPPKPDSSAVDDDDSDIFESPWLLEGGEWDDSGVWDDAAIWEDG